MGKSERAAISLALRMGDGVAVFHARGNLPVAVDALAAGADSAYVFTGNVALRFQVAVLGLGALGEWGDELAGQLAEDNQATLIFDVLDAQRTESGLLVERDLGRGNRERLLVRGPAVLVLSPQARRGPYVSHYKLQMAAKALHAGAGHAASGFAETPAVDARAWQPLRPRARSTKPNIGPSANDRLGNAFGLAETPADSRGQIITAEPETCALHLLRYLAHHGFIGERAGPVPAASGSSSHIVPVNEPQASGGPESLTVGYGRGPRRTGDLPQRFGRRPRPVAEAAPVVAAQQQKTDLPASIARRPRLANQAGMPGRHRGPRPA